MNYMLLIYTDETADQGSPEDFELMMKEYNEFSTWLADSGMARGGGALQSVQTATTVRVRDGVASTTDGPFTETKEQLGGYFLIEADDLDAAIEAASRIPGAKVGAIEIRPLMEFG